MKDFFKFFGVFSAEGRKAWAFLSMLIGCGLMTAMASVVLYLVRADSFYVFCLGLAAHAQVFVGLTGFTAFFVRRDVEITRDSVSVKDLPPNGDRYGSVFDTYEQGLRGPPIGYGGVPRMGRDSRRPRFDRYDDRAEQRDRGPEYGEGQRDLFDWGAEPMQRERYDSGRDRGEGWPSRSGGGPAGEGNWPERSEYRD